MFFETIAILCILKKNMTEKEKSIKSLFVTYFDGWDEQSDTLTVHLRHPGLLIGRAGSTINALQKYLDCNIKVIEVNLQK
jgi:ribosomal protein S3